MKSGEVTILVSLASAVLVFGLLTTGRILVVIHRRQSSAAIDKLFLSNARFGFVCHPFILVYYIAKYLLYPMKDYIGVAGCVAIALLVDVYVRFYHFCFPASVALLRKTFSTFFIFLNPVAKILISAVIFTTYL
jgi:hypothetical protein